MVGLFFVFPALVYWALVTDLNFDIFAPGGYWRAYNHYFMAMLDGRLDIPAWSIGLEGQYWDGKVYIYYGIAPLVVRAIAWPFVNLETTSLSRLSIWLFLVAGNSALQWVLIGHFKQKAVGGQDGRQFFLLGLFSLIVWFGSGSTIIIQGSSIYHEPYAASLFLLCIFVAIFAKDVVWADGPSRYRLVVYAVLAALCIHARAPAAVGMLLASAALIFVATFEHCRSNHNPEQRNPGRYFVTFVRNGFWPAVVVAVSMGVYFWMNDLRFGAWNAMGDFRHMGVFLSGEGYSDRICAFVTNGAFSFRRMLPNAMFYLFGSVNIHGDMIAFLDLVKVRLEGPRTFLAIIWLMPLALFGMFWNQFWRPANRMAVRPILAVVAGLCVGGGVMLAYATVTYRYAGDLWAPLLLTSVVMAGYLSNLVSKLSSRVYRNLAGAVTVAMLCSFSLSAITYNFGYKNAFPHDDDAIAQAVPKNLDPTRFGVSRECRKYIK